MRREAGVRHLECGGVCFCVEGGVGVCCLLGVSGGGSEEPLLVAEEATAGEAQLEHRTRLARLALLALLALSLALTPALSPALAARAARPRRKQLAPPACGKQPARSGGGC